MIDVSRQPQWACAFLSSLIAALLACHAHAADLESYESRYYVVHTDATLEETQPLAEHMDAVFVEFAGRFRELLGGRPDRDKLDLYLLSTKEAYVRFLAELDINGTASGGMFFNDDQNRFAVATYIRGRSLLTTKQVLQHEGFHQFAFSFVGPDMPRWIDEGLATYFQYSVFVDGRLRLGMAPPKFIEGMQMIVEDEGHFPLDGFINITQEQWLANMSDPAKQTTQYLQAWTLTYFLVHGDNGRYQRALNQYLSRIASGQPSAQAFQGAFRTDRYDAMEQRWLGYVEDDLEADDFSVNFDRMYYMGLTAMLATRGGLTLPEELDAYIELLQLQDIVLENAIGHVLSPNDLENFQYINRRGRAVPISYVFDAASGLPVISAPDAESPVRIVWSYQGDQLTYDLAYD